MLDFAEELKRSRIMGVPILAVNTADQQNTVRSIAKILNGDTPILIWDISQGLKPIPKSVPSQQAHRLMLNCINPPPKGSDSDMIEAAAIAAQGMSVNLDQMLAAAGQGLPKTGVLIICNAHAQIEPVLIAQCISNLRDRFTGDTRTLILLGPSFKFPEILVQDIVTIDEPLPDEKRIKEIVSKIATDSEIAVDDDTLIKASAALKGFSEFPIEQITALSVRKNAKNKFYISVPELWDRKRRMLEQVPGLKLIKTTYSFDAVGGLASVKQFAKDLFNGPMPPIAIIYFDEIEKSFAGSGNDGGATDGSGTTQDALSVILKVMENFELPGQINFGPPGSGKSMLAKAMAANFGIPCLEVDLGDAKGKYVGESEQKIRAVIKAVLAIAGEDGAYFIATCNKLNTLPPELRRRFRFGLWLFDIPTLEERVSIANLIAKRPKFAKVKADPDFWAKETNGWSGANIRDCYDIAWRLNRDLRTASKSIVPAEAQDAEGIKIVRKLAHGKFLSASYDGVYFDPTQPAPLEDSMEKNRKINV